MSSKKKRKHAADGFDLYVMGGHLNARCKACGVIPEIEYAGLDPIYPIFHLVCDGCSTYDFFKIYMTTRYLTPEPYKGRRLFERAQLKRMRSITRA